ncbi:MAG: energy transducer TonB [Acidobacteria bacterium]|jgi:TonB family protein|nr:energy transducer TonB [Acidobacteriota bacterium]
MDTPNDFQLGLLPERKMDWRTLVTSYGVEAAVILLILLVGAYWPQDISLRQRYTVTELIPRPDLQPKPIKTRAAAHPVKTTKLLPKVAVSAPKLVVPKEFRVARKKKEKEEELEAPKVALNSFAPAMPSVAGGARLAKVVYTGSFGSSATPTLNAPIEKVQTGGFGDPNGVQGQGKENARLTVAKVGSFDMPPGAGSGNGAGGAQGQKGVIASAGFGNGIAQSGQGDGRSNGRGTPIQTGGFGAQEVAQGGGRSKAVDNGAPTTQVEITYKPNPVYTEEARQLRLQGEVLLEVMFGANGQLHVNRVVRGLGHGLDEAAIVAANQMHFKPALRNGLPVESTAVVHVVFQLAY